MILSMAERAVIGRRHHYRSRRTSSRWDRCIPRRCYSSRRLDPAKQKKQIPRLGGLSQTSCDRLAMLARGKRSTQLQPDRPMVCLLPIYRRHHSEIRRYRTLPPRPIRHHPLHPYDGSHLPHVLAIPRLAERPHSVFSGPTRLFHLILCAHCQGIPLIGILDGSNAYRAEDTLT